MAEDVGDLQTLEAELGDGNGDQNLKRQRGHTEAEDNRLESYFVENCELETSWLWA